MTMVIAINIMHSECINMSEFMNIWLSGLGVMLAIGLAGWLLSLRLNNVTIVDSLWSLMFLAASVAYIVVAESFNDRTLFIFGLIGIWALRLSMFLTMRNWGQPEDRRYQEIRNNNEPHFNLKSLYIVFGLQAGLAWIISLPLLLAVSQPAQFTIIDLLAGVLWLAGFIYESVADYQLHRFKTNSANKGKVLASGLWRYSRHPNYFGEFLIWWGFYLFAVPLGGWWTIIAPLLMTVLLLKVSGVALMEKDITNRRAKYRHYIESTNAFFPRQTQNQHSTLGAGAEGMTMMLLKIGFSFYLASIMNVCGYGGWSEHMTLDLVYLRRRTLAGAGGRH